MLHPSQELNAYVFLQPATKDERGGWDREEEDGEGGQEARKSRRGKKNKCLPVK